MQTLTVTPAPFELAKHCHHICFISALSVSYASMCSDIQGFSVDYQLRSKRLRWFGHICRMPDSRLPKLLLHGQVARQSCRGKPRTVWNDVVSSEMHKLKLNHYTRDAQNKPVWRELREREKITG